MRNGDQVSSPVFNKVYSAVVFRNMGSAGKQDKRPVVSVVALGTFQVSKGGETLVL